MDTRSSCPQLYMLHATLHKLAVTQRDVWEASGSNVVIVDKSCATMSVLTSACVSCEMKRSPRGQTEYHTPARPILHNRKKECVWTFDMSEVTTQADSSSTKYTNNCISGQFQRWKLQLTSWSAVTFWSEGQPVCNGGLSALWTQLCTVLYFTMDGSIPLMKVT